MLSSEQTERNSFKWFTFFMFRTFATSNEHLIVVCTEHTVQHQHHQSSSLAFNHVPKPRAQYVIVYHLFKHDIIEKPSIYVYNVMKRSESE